MQLIKSGGRAPDHMDTDNTGTAKETARMMHMKTMILNGSPRKNWNTAMMLK